MIVGVATAGEEAPYYGPRLIEEQVRIAASGYEIAATILRPEGAGHGIVPKLSEGPPRPFGRELLADVALVGIRRRVERQQGDAVPAREQLDRLRVVAQARAAIHAGGARGDRQNVHH